MKITKDIIARLADSVKDRLDYYVEDPISLEVIQEAIRDEFINILTEELYEDFTD